MNCGVYCVKRLFYDLGKVFDENELKNEISVDGLSIYAIISFLQKEGIDYEAYYSKKIVLEEKIILYDAKGRHYYYVSSYDKLFVYMSDVNLKDFRILRCFYPFIYSKYIIKKRLVV